MFLNLKNDSEPEVPGRMLSLSSLPYMIHGKDKGVLMSHSYLEDQAEARISYEIKALLHTVSSLWHWLYSLNYSSINQVVFLTF